jgi:hypothetical protein
VAADDGAPLTADDLCDPVRHVRRERREAARSRRQRQTRGPSASVLSDHAVEGQASAAERRRRRLVGLVVEEEDDRNGPASQPVRSFEVLRTVGVGPEEITQGVNEELWPLPVAQAPPEPFLESGLDPGKHPVHRLHGGSRHVGDRRAAVVLGEPVLRVSHRDGGGGVGCLEHLLPEVLARVPIEGIGEHVDTAAGEECRLGHARRIRPATRKSKRGVMYVTPGEFVRMGRQEDRPATQAGRSCPGGRVVQLARRSGHGWRSHGTRCRLCVARQRRA